MIHPAIHYSWKSRFHQQFLLKLKGSEIIMQQHKANLKYDEGLLLHHLGLKKVLQLQKELLLKIMLQPKSDKELLLLHCLLLIFLQSQSVEGDGGAVSHKPSFFFPMSPYLNKSHDEGGDHPFGLEEIRRRVHWKKKVWGEENSNESCHQRCSSELRWSQ